MTRICVVIFRCLPAVFLTLKTLLYRDVLHGMATQTHPSSHNTSVFTAALVQSDETCTSVNVEIGSDFTCVSSENRTYRLRFNVNIMDYDVALFEPMQSQAMDYVMDPSNHIHLALPGTHSYDIFCGPLLLVQFSGDRACSMDVARFLQTWHWWHNNEPPLAHTIVTPSPAPHVPCERMHAATTVEGSVNPPRNVRQRVTSPRV